MGKKETPIRKDPILARHVTQLRRKLSRWLDPDLFDTSGPEECMQLGLPLLAEKYGESSIEVSEARLVLTSLTQT